MERKVMVGPRLRRMRMDKKLTQTEMASQLGISASYLNLIERNQRPVTVQLLLKLGQTFEVDLQRFAVDDEARVVALLTEVFSDPFFSRQGITQQDIRDISAACPLGGEAIFSLFRAYKELIDNTLTLGEGISKGNKLEKLTALNVANEEVQNWVQSCDNYFPDLEETAELLWQNSELDADSLYENLRSHLSNAHGVKIRVLPLDVMEGTLSRYDRHGRRLMLSELLSPGDRLHQLAYQIALLDYSSVLDDLVEQADFENVDSRRLLRIKLANYMAGAVIMPYDSFLQAAKALRYDIDLLANRFVSTYNQICRRLTNLHRPGNRGVGFFFVRVDCSGNILDSFSNNGFYFARSGGLCPEWGVNNTFLSSGNIRSEFIQMPDGSTYFTISRLINQQCSSHTTKLNKFILSIGCEASYAENLIYADRNSSVTQDNPIKIGINCRLCDRIECRSRAYPPTNRRLVIDENQQDISPYFFA